MDNKRVYLKYMPGQSLFTESRNKREISAAKEFGFDICVFSTDDSDSVKDLLIEGAEHICDGKKKIMPGTNPLVRKLFALRNLFTIYKNTTKLEADIFSCHDLMSLQLAYAAKRKKNVVFIYDSHEFELGRNKRRGVLKKKYIKWAEGFLMRRCAFSIMVNKSIADEVKKIHQLHNDPVVVRSTPENWTIDKSVCETKKKEIISSFNCDISFLIMYHGAVTNGRGLEALIEAISRINNVGLFILGNASSVAYKTNLIRLTEKLNIQSRVLFHDAVSIEKLWEYVGAADVSMVNISPIVKSYYYALPNKLFESVQSMTPVIVSKLPELERIVNEYDIGLVVKPDNVEDIEKAILRLQNDKSLYSRLKENMEYAKEELCWDKEKHQLFDAYSKYVK